MSKVRKLTVEEYENAPWLHIHQPGGPHEGARIVGTASGLRAFRDALNDALGEPDLEFAAVDAAGEGYGVRVQRVTRRQMDDFSVPYVNRDLPE